MILGNQNVLAKFVRSDHFSKLIGESRESSYFYATYVRWVNKSIFRSVLVRIENKTLFIQINFKISRKKLSSEPFGEVGNPRLFISHS